MPAAVGLDQVEITRVWIFLSRRVVFQDMALATQPAMGSNLAPLARVTEDRIRILIMN
jgi:hypothetical protein